MTDQNKTHGVLTDKAAQLIPLLQSFLDRLSNDDCSGLMFEADGDTLRETIVLLRTINRAPQSPVAVECERCGKVPETHTPGHHCNNQSFKVSDSTPVTPAGCKTCGGSRVDPGGLPACRDCTLISPANESVCKGSFVLGNGCGKCKGCLGEMQNHGRPDATTVSATNGYDALRALADIAKLLGLPDDGCNDPQVKVSALADFIAGHKDMQKSRDELLDDNYALATARTPLTSAGGES